MSVFKEEIHAFRELANSSRSLTHRYGCNRWRLEVTEETTKQIKQIFATLPDVRKNDISVYIEPNHYEHGRRMSSKIWFDSESWVELAVEWTPAHTNQYGEVDASFLLVIKNS